MHTRTGPSRWVPALAAGTVAVATLVASAPAHAQEEAAYRNVTAGGTLRPGVYGRIVPRAKAPPPPLIYPKPVIASALIVPAKVTPVYLYVPPGQVRKWKKNCARWKACDQPVLFVRMDHSPSRWGEWRQLRENDLALPQDD
jgi:hypothetical protein